VSAFSVYTCWRARPLQARRPPFCHKTIVFHRHILSMQKHYCPAATLLTVRHHFQLPRMTATTTSKSVYDRLYKANTASSKNRKEIASVIPKNILMRENDEPANKPSTRTVRSQNPRPKKTTKSSSTDGEVFSRLYSKGTASSMSKRSENAHDSSVRVPMKPKNRS
jgi:hypothetical protein